MLDETQKIWKAIKLIQCQLCSAEPSGISLGPIGSSPNANGATLSSLVLNLEPANFSFGGVLTNTAQDIGGAKTLNDVLTIQKTAISGREYLIRSYVSDAGNDQFFAGNSTLTASHYSPVFGGYMASVWDASSLAFRALTSVANDSGSIALMAFTSAITSSATDPNNGTFSSLTSKPLFSWGNAGTIVMLLKASGVLNITNTPVFADNAAAITGGLVAGDVYRTGDALKICH